MPSARSAATAAALALFGLGGCATTQQQAARLRLNDARIRAADSPVRVARPNPQIMVNGVALIRDAGGVVLIVRLRNLADDPVTDLPISVGLLLSGGRRQLLNAAPGLAYFRTHVPVIAGRGRLTWVFTTGQRLPPSQRAFAVVGIPGSGFAPAPRTLPRITAQAAARGRGSFTLTLRNRSSVPQYELPVYAVAVQAGRYVAGGWATIDELAAGTTTTLRLSVVGNPTGASMWLEAPPTIYG